MKFAGCLALVLALAMGAAPACAADPTEWENIEDLPAALLDKFLRYVAYDTMSDPDSSSSPSTAGQMEFAKILAKECEAIGLAEVEVSEYGVVTATLPGNINGEVPVLAFVVHMDTSPDASGVNIVPRVHENYDGKDIVLDGGTVLSTEEFPALLNYVGQTVITAGGGTLLGSDDKSGVAIVLTAMEYLILNPTIPHGTVRIAITPDEEIGRGTEHLDVAAFGADFGYTVDGGALGELEYENFNAAAATLEITGRSIHPGTAKGIMKNSVLIAAELAAAFPAEETPAATEGYEGFYHLDRVEGMVEKTVMHIIIRCFDREEFEARKGFVSDLAAQFNEKYGEGTVKATITDQYYNMKEKIDPAIIEYAKAAFEAAGVTPVIVPIRGGTDGAMLSYKGLPCPNLFTGGYNFHGPYEFNVLESMEKAARVVINLCIK